MFMPDRLLIVGIGNELLGDEGLGVHVARRLLARGTPVHADVLEAGTALFDALPELARYRHVILVDAICAGGVPGTVYRADIREDLSGGVEGTLPLSLHQAGLFDILASARLLGLLPKRLTLVGAEPDRLAPSLELSPAVEGAAERIVAELLREGATTCTS
jgi:hydrogenase maturation protease